MFPKKLRPRLEERLMRYGVHLFSSISRYDNLLSELELSEEERIQVCTAKANSARKQTVVIHVDSILTPPS